MNKKIITKIYFNNDLNDMKEIEEILRKIRNEEYQNLILFIARNSF